MAWSTAAVVTLAVSLYAVACNAVWNGTYSKLQYAFVEPGSGVAAWASLAVPAAGWSPAVALPFAFNLFGERVNTAWVSPHGFLVLGNTAPGASEWMALQKALGAAGAKPDGIVAYWAYQMITTGARYETGVSPSGADGRRVWFLHATIPGGYACNSGAPPTDPLDVTLTLSETAADDPLPGDINVYVKSWPTPTTAGSCLRRFQMGFESLDGTRVASEALLTAPLRPQRPVTFSWSARRVSPCATSHCQLPGGTCYVNSSFGATCVCTLGYSGADCSAYTPEPGRADDEFDDPDAPLPAGSVAAIVLGLALAFGVAGAGCYWYRQKEHSARELAQLQLQHRPHRGSADGHDELTSVVTGGGDVLGRTSSGSIAGGGLASAGVSRQASVAALMLTGSDQIELPPLASGTRKECRLCHRMNDADTRFCGHCGARHLPPVPQKSPSSVGGDSESGTTSPAGGLSPSTSHHTLNEAAAAAAAGGAGSGAGRALLMPSSPPSPTHAGHTVASAAASGLAAALGASSDSNPGTPVTATRAVAAATASTSPADTPPPARSVSPHVPPRVLGAGGQRKSHIRTTSGAPLIVIDGAGSAEARTAHAAAAADVDADEAYAESLNRNAKGSDELRAIPAGLVSAVRRGSVSGGTGFGGSAVRRPDLINPRTAQVLGGLAATLAATPERTGTESGTNSGTNSGNASPSNASLSARDHQIPPPPPARPVPSGSLSARLAGAGARRASSGAIDPRSPPPASSVAARGSPALKALAGPPADSPNSRQLLGSSNRRGSTDSPANALAAAAAATAAESGAAVATKSESPRLTLAAAIAAVTKGEQPSRGSAKAPANRRASTSMLHDSSSALAIMKAANAAAAASGDKPSPLAAAGLSLAPSGQRRTRAGTLAQPLAGGKPIAGTAGAAGAGGGGGGGGRFNFTLTEGLQRDGFAAGAGAGFGLSAPILEQSDEPNTAPADSSSGSSRHSRSSSVALMSPLPSPPGGGGSSSAAEVAAVATAAASKPPVSPAKLKSPPPPPLPRPAALKPIPPPGAAGLGGGSGGAKSPNPKSPNPKSPKPPVSPTKAKAKAKPRMDDTDGL